MKLHLSRYLICVSLLCVVSLLALLLIPRSAIEVVEIPLSLWKTLCETLTPDSWQVQGNILLGLLWLISGFVALCFVAVIPLTAGWAVVDVCRRRDSKDDAAEMP